MISPSTRSPETGDRVIRQGGCEGRRKSGRSVPATEDGMQAGKHPQAIATKVLVPRCVGLMHGSRSSARCRPLTVSVALSFCADAASALVSASTGDEPNAKVAAPDVARKRRRDKRKHTPSTALPPTAPRYIYYILPIAWWGPGLAPISARMRNHRDLDGGWSQRPSAPYRCIRSAPERGTDRL
jgi:hypothetical protein